MIKICPRCRRTFSGGTRCLHCSEEIALLDLAEPAVRRAHLRGDSDLRVTIRTYYGARSAMLLQFVGILFGLALALALARKSAALAGGARWVMAVLAGCAAVAIPAATAFIGAKLVHRFSKSCRRKPLRPSELRVVRRGQGVS
jgi:hypothetical protein